MRWRRGLKQLRGAQQKGTEQSSDEHNQGTRRDDVIWRVFLIFKLEPLMLYVQWIEH